MGNLKEEEVFNNTVINLKEGETMRLPEWNKFWYKKNGEIFRQKNKDNDDSKNNTEENIALRKDWIVEFKGFGQKEDDVRVYKSINSGPFHRFNYVRNNNLVLDVEMVKINGDFFLISVDGNEDIYGKHKGKFHIEKKEFLNKFPDVLTHKKECQLVLASDNPSYGVPDIDFDSLKKGYDIMFDIHNKKHLKLKVVKITQLKINDEWVSLSDESLGVERKGEYRSFLKILYIKN